MPPEKQETAPQAIEKETIQQRIINYSVMTGFTSEIASQTYLYPSARIRALHLHRDLGRLLVAFPDIDDLKDMRLTPGQRDVYVSLTSARMCLHLAIDRIVHAAEDDPSSAIDYAQEQLGIVSRIVMCVLAESEKFEGLPSEMFETKFQQGQAKYDLLSSEKDIEHSRKSGNARDQILARQRKILAELFAEIVGLRSTEQDNAEQETVFAMPFTRQKTE